MKEQGPKGLVSKNRGKPSNRKIHKHLRSSILDLIYSKYSDFGLTLAHEKLSEVNNMAISVSTVRNIMVNDGIWIPKKAKKKRIFQHRQRRPSEGEPVQLDGSDHQWFEKQRV